jgi:predicted ATPase
LPLFEEAIAVFEMAGGSGQAPLLLTEVARATLAVGDFHRTKSLLDDAEADVESSGMYLWQPGVPHARGLLAAAQGDAAEAERQFVSAIEIARGQDNHLLELRGARDMARVWHDQGRTEEARDILEPAYSWFTEGFELPDLKDAEALLTELK